MTPDDQIPSRAQQQPTDDPNRYDYDIDRSEPLSPALPVWEAPDPYRTAPLPAERPSPTPPAYGAGGNYDLTSQSLNNTVNVTVGGPVIVAPQTAGTPFIVRALWFLFIGWWLSGVATLVAYVLMISIIGMPLAFALINKIPQLTTLRPRNQVLNVTAQNGVITMGYQNQEQYALWLRVIYFLAIGFWAGYIWLSLAWLLQVLVLTIPISILMYDRAPAVITLHKH